VQVTSRSDPLAELIIASRRVAAVQRALTEYGYGQLKPTGTVGSDTSAAIQKFERERKLPVTGQISDRLVRELGAVTGRAMD
jgi:peptidoglycan hydrolase-like protein with peptidoglycan-binding domain